MSQNLKEQLAASEKLVAAQKDIIDNQNKQISLLQKMNSRLENEVAELRSYAESLSADYDEVVSMCKEQQDILNSLIK